ncbi:hypothetical protein EVAR_97742_1 [Eumeta japonica]|uniref:Uncharacterized protein n=1 Tax=Eumeta variegata TaxID=151549 RepID=A0A4C1X869_EUMVA|nr:hypothetical protein EVAR_97742_1 [Eumeta japonica]
MFAQIPTWSPTQVYSNSNIISRYSRLFVRSTAASDLVQVATQRPVVVSGEISALCSRRCIAENSPAVEF